MKKITALVLAALMFLASCAQSPAESTEESATVAEGGTTEEEIVEVAEEEPEETLDIPEDVKFSGTTFTFGVVDNQNARNFIVMDEVNGEALNDAQYDTVQKTQELLDVTIAQNILTTGYPAASALIPFITAGDDSIQIGNVFCVDATTLLTQGYIRGYEDIPYIDLTKSWWDSTINDSMVLGDMRYAAIGDLSISTHDLTYILVFSQSLVENNQLESPYSLVLEGNWTMDKMNDMMTTVLLDANGNGERDEEDVYGYLGANKMVLPSFWVAAGEKTMELDETGTPVLAVEDERFLSVFNKIFEITYDNNARFKTATESADVPSECINMFAENHSLFMDCSLYWVGNLRDMDTDFGVIPYPKYDENQEDYYARVSYYMPPVIPVTSMNNELIGAVLETANYYAKQYITPAYYDITLKGKYSRDQESIQMLDLIFSHRVVDLGDTLFCSNVRDGFMSSCYSSDNRNLTSVVKAQSKVITKTIEKMMKTINGEEE